MGLNGEELKHGQLFRLRFRFLLLAFGQNMGKFEHIVLNGSTEALLMQSSSRMIHRKVDTPVVVTGTASSAPDPLAAEFAAEQEVFGEMWDNLTKLLLAKDGVRFAVGGKLTADGKVSHWPFSSRWWSSILPPRSRRRRTARRW